MLLCVISRHRQRHQPLQDTHSSTTHAEKLYFRDPTPCIAEKITDQAWFALIDLTSRYAGRSRTPESIDQSAECGGGAVQSRLPQSLLISSRSLHHVSPLASSDSLDLPRQRRRQCVVHC